MSAEEVESVQAIAGTIEEIEEDLDEITATSQIAEIEAAKDTESENIEGEAEKKGVVSAGEVFQELAKELGVKTPTTETTAENEGITEEESAERPRKKRRYIGKSARINAELMREALRELKKAYARSYQPEVVDSIERAVRLLKIIIAENEDVFPGVIKQKG